MTVRDVSTTNGFMESHRDARPGSVIHTGSVGLDARTGRLVSSGGCTSTGGSPSGENWWTTGPGCKPILSALVLEE
jgi:hypothetical protein